MGRRGHIIPSTAFIYLVFFILPGCEKASDLSTPERDRKATAEESAARAAAWLWSRQAEDGGWHSDNYGLLKSGQSLTPFVLNVLLQVPPEIHPLPNDNVARAFEFIKRNTNADGILGRADPAVDDYPNYATALAVQVWCRARRTGWETAVAPMLAALRRQQFTEEQGWKKEDPAYGGWGVGGAPRRPPFPGQIDISTTRYVLEAFAMAGPPPNDPVLVKARAFLERCQNRSEKTSEDDDGGFFFSPVVLLANKAGQKEDRFRSYGTATADGILSLLAAGVPANDDRVVSALDWLVSHHIVGAVPGFERSTEEARQWSRGVLYYYCAGASEIRRRLDIRKPLNVAGFLIETQNKSGYWTNANFRMKEDDPLIATPLALTALLNAR